MPSNQPSTSSVSYLALRIIKGNEDDDSTILNRIAHRVNSSSSSVARPTAANKVYFRNFLSNEP